LIVAALSLSLSAFLIGAAIFPYGAVVEEHLPWIAGGITLLGLAAIVCKNERRLLTVAILCLPLTQAPTIKALIRWRISEVIGWTLLLNHFRSGIGKSYGRPVLFFMGSSALYFIYTGLIGIALAPVTEVHVAKVLEYYINPFFRTLLETARGVAAISIILAMLKLAANFSEIRKYCALLVWGGAISGTYTVYQSSVLAFGIPLPLLPETLWHKGSFRAFGTFYEPTGTGSFTAVAILLCLYFVASERRKIGWIGCLALNALGFFISLSRAGWIGLLAGAGVLVICNVTSRREAAVPLAMPMLGACALGLGGWISEYVLGAPTVRRALSEHWLRETASPRLEAYSQIPIQLTETWGVGFGQGLYIFRGGGAPGFVRLILEGGLPGTLLLLIMHGAAIHCVRRLLANDSSDIRRLSAFIGAAYASCTVTTLNYINTTDMWIWVVWALPVISFGALMGSRH
jgi:hypothetical protein